VGTALGPYGLPIMDFVRAFNDKTKDQQGQVLPVVLTIYEDKTFSFAIKKSPMAVLIKKELGLDKGAQTAGTQTVAKLSKSQARKIAEEKLPDLNTDDLEQAIKIVEGTARSMGVEITD
jgi:large subunit ribosomal protein L11